MTRPAWTTRWPPTPRMMSPTNEAVLQFLSLMLIQYVSINCCTGLFLFSLTSQDAGLVGMYACRHVCFPDGYADSLTRIYDITYTHYRSGTTRAWCTDDWGMVHGDSNQEPRSERI